MVFCVMAIVGAAVGTAAAEKPTIDIPYIEGITIDGSADDWGDRGFKASMTTAVEGFTAGEADFGFQYRVAWCKEGLLVLSQVTDSEIFESTDSSNLQWGDSLQIWLGNGEKFANYIRIVVSTDVDPKYGHRFLIWDRRKDKSGKLSVTFKGKKTPGGYTVEALVPWSNLGISPKKGDILGFQTDAVDVDSGKGRCRLLWGPAGFVGDPWENPEAFYPIRLSDTASESSVATSYTSASKHASRVQVHVKTLPELIGKTVSLGGIYEGLPAQTVKAGEQGWGKAVFEIPVDKDIETGYRVPVLLDGKLIASTTLSGYEWLLGPESLVRANLRFTPAVFSGPGFPSCDFEQPLLAEEVLGPYSIKTTFYNSNYDVVTAAEKPGWYGAVVEIIPDNGGKSVKRFRTVYRQAAPYEWSQRRIDASITLPSELGIDPKVAAGQSGTISSWLTQTIRGAFSEKPGNYPLAISYEGSTAELLGGLSEMKPGTVQASRQDDAFAVDRQKWVGLKRKYYGLDKEYPNAFVCPKPKEGTPARVVREGTLAEAGMKPDAFERIDGILKQWEADTDEAFAVTIVRHGVVVLNKAYGMRDGKPMTLETKSWMASVSKSISANLVWMTIDQGLTDLDAPIDKYLPALRGIQVKTPITIRHLLTHTAGFRAGDHWGDDRPDLDEIAADMYPYLRVGEAFAYNGLDLAVGSKIVEAVSGECLPMFYKRHLFDPLGMQHTDIVGSSGDARSVSSDMAKLGQMMLNGGAYGNMRFYSEETLKKMLPRKLTKTLGPDSKAIWGVGVTIVHDNVLSPNTFGHPGASGAALQIDLDNDMVIATTRDTNGSNFGKYRPLFLKTVVDCIDKDE